MQFFKTISIIIILSSSLLLSAQQKKIFVSMIDGSNIEGKIAELNYLKYTYDSSFTIQNTIKHVIDVNEMSEIEIQDKGLYKTYLINDVKVLCFVKLDGPIKLLYHQDKIYALSGDNLKLLTEEVGSENYFKKNLALLVNGETEYTQHLQDIEFKKYSIESFIIKYNENESDGNDIYIYSPNSSTKTKFMIGYTKRFDETFDAAPISSSGINFNSQVFTVEASFSNLDYAQNLSLTTGVWYTIESYDLEGFRNERQVIESNTISTANGETFSQIDTITVIDIAESGSYKNNSIQFPVYLEFLNSNNILSYYGAFGFALNVSNVKREFEISNDISESKLGGKLFLEAGLAINPIKNIRINISYNIDTQLNIRARALF